MYVAVLVPPSSTRAFVVLRVLLDLHPLPCFVRSSYDFIACGCVLIYVVVRRGIDLRSKFKDILIEKSPKDRAFYGYPTSVVDTAATRLTLGSGEHIPLPFVMPLLPLWDERLIACGCVSVWCWLGSARWDIEESSEERGFLVAMKDGRFNVGCHPRLHILSLTPAR